MREEFDSLRNAGATSVHFECNLERSKAGLDRSWCCGIVVDDEIQVFRFGRTQNEALANAIALYTKGK